MCYNCCHAKHGPRKKTAAQKIVACEESRWLPNLHLDGPKLVDSNCNWAARKNGTVFALLELRWMFRQCQCCYLPRQWKQEFGFCTNQIISNQSWHSALPTKHIKGKAEVCSALSGQNQRGSPTTYSTGLAFILRSLH